MILVDAQSISASRPGRPLFTDVHLTVNDGDRIGIVGINGCGKSTMLRMLSGEDEPETGVVRRGRGVRVGVLTQQSILPKGTVRHAVGKEWLGESVLDRLGMTPLIDVSTDQLSGGQRKRVALARLLVEEFELLILDEPTNHLDLDAIAFVEDQLASFTGGLLIVTHDRHLLDRVTTKVLEIDRGGTYLHVPQGWNAGSGYAAYLAGRETREEQAATSEQARKNLARTELAWLRRGAPARSTKPKARMDAAKAIVSAKAQSAARTGDLGLSLGTARLGSKAIEIEGVGFTWPNGATVVSPFDHIIEPGDRLGLVGQNGAGKSTLLDLIAGRLKPTVGKIELGTTVKLGYYDQLGRELDLTKRVRDIVAGDRGAPSYDDVRLMERFWFDGDAQWAPVGTLSGGERRRLQLLLTLIEQPNVLLLDEPTNDLDLDTLRALEDFLDTWPGLLVVVSHDRVFLDRTIEEVMVIEPGTAPRLVRGGVAGWMAERAANTDSRKGNLAPQAAPPVVADGARVPPVARPSGRTPSTLRRLLSQAERELKVATERRVGFEAALSSASDHSALAAAAEGLAAVQTAMDTAESAWLDLAAEAETLGLEV